MGELIKMAAQGTLHYVPKQEFGRVRSISASATACTDLFATLARINTLYMIARAGSGHIGSSFSSLDIVSWLFLNELRLPSEGDPTAPRDIYFSSKGHDVPGLYAVLAGCGLLPFEAIHRLRRLDGLPGHPDVSTPFIETNTGSLGMGISKAKGMALAHRMQGKDARIFVLTGDGELQEGQIWESLISAANGGFGEITVIVDHNKIQSDTRVERTSHLGDLEAKFAAFGWHVVRCDGHDLESFSSLLGELKTVTDRPKAVIADTVKGKGVSFMEHTAMKPADDLYRFHSGAPDAGAYKRAAEELIAEANERLHALGQARLEVEAEEADPGCGAGGNQQCLVVAYSRALVAQAERNPQIIALDADLRLDCGLVPFKERFPDRFVECGIAEQDMVSQAGGMALKGLLPVVHSFACFLSTRANEQIYNNATERTKIVYVGALAGLLPAGPGHSHQSVRDISALAAVPGLALIEPADEAEVELAVDYCLNGTEESCYLRLVSIPCDIPYELPHSYQLEPGKGVTLRDGADAVVFGYGPVLLSEAWRAAEVLARDDGTSLKLVNLPWLNRVDDAWLRQAVDGHSAIFTLDDHYLAGGQGEMIASRLAELGLSGQIRVRRLGVTGVPLCGRNDEVLRAHGLDSAGLAKAVAAALAAEATPA